MFRQNQQPEKATCPFNPNHVFHKEKLIFHINRCKDRAKVEHLYAKCKYNGLHFIKKQNIEEHQLFCEDREGCRKLTESMRRNYESIREEREKSQKKRKEEEKGNKVKHISESQSDECTLSECEDCLAALTKINVEQHPKLKKYLQKYEKLLKESTE